MLLDVDDFRASGVWVVDSPSPTPYQRRHCGAPPFLFLGPENSTDEGAIACPPNKGIVESPWRPFDKPDCVVQDNIQCPAAEGFGQASQEQDPRKPSEADGAMSRQLTSRDITRRKIPVRTSFTRIGLVLSLENGFLRGVLRGIKRFAASRPNWILIPTPCDPDRIAELRSLHVKGLIAAVSTEKIAHELEALGRPVVDVEAELPGLRFPQIDVDCEESGRLAARHFLERGLRHFAFFGVPGRNYSARREVGFREVIEASGHTLKSYHENVWTLCTPRGRL